jgi:hypothetical protein
MAQLDNPRANVEARQCRFHLLEISRIADKARRILKQQRAQSTGFRLSLDAPR